MKDAMKRVLAVLGAIGFTFALMASVPQPVEATCGAFPCDSACWDCGIEEMYWDGDLFITEWACTCEDDCVWRTYVDDGETVTGSCTVYPC